MKQVLVPLIGVAVFIVFVGILTQKTRTEKFNLLPTPTPQKQIKIGETRLLVEIAETESERKKGLSTRKTLGENEGMLFVFSQKKVFPSFWMKEMLIPIDIIWITDGKITKISKNVQPHPSETAESNLTLYYPDKPIDYVLEVAAGISDKNNIKVGNAVDLSQI